jgi:hypothetical protein
LNFFSRGIGLSPFVKTGTSEIRPDYLVTSITTFQEKHHYLFGVLSVILENRLGS